MNLGLSVCWISMGFPPRRWGGRGDGGVGVEWIKRYNQDVVESSEPELTPDIDDPKLSPSCRTNRHPSNKVCVYVYVCMYVCV